jgi:hypothetical protein
LLQAEGVLQFLFEELAEQDNSMSVQLKVEISKRRDKSLVSLLRFLAKKSNCQSIFCNVLKTKIIKTAKISCDVFSASSNPMISVNRMEFQKTPLW